MKIWKDLTASNMTSSNARIDTSCHLVTPQLVCELPHYTKNPFGQELPRNPPTKKKNNDLKLKDNKTQKKMVT